MHLSTLTFALFTLLAAPTLHAAATDLDTSFNGGGIATDYLDLPGTALRDTFADAALATSTGSIYSVGNVEYTSTAMGPTHGVLFKRLANGAKDTAFSNGSGGASRVLFGVQRSGGSSALNGVDFDGSNTGAVAVVGFEDLNNNQRCGVAYKVLDNAVSKGALDGSFATSGRLTYCSGSGADLVFSDVKVLPDGRWLVSGSSRTSTGEQYGFLLRLLANGQFDSSFNAYGINGFAGQMTFNIRPGKDDSALRIAAGSTAYYVGGNSLYWDNPDGAYTDDLDLWVARVNVNGTLDTTFNSTGVRIEALDVAGSDRTDLLVDIKVDASGRPLLLAAVNPGHAIFASSGGLDPNRFYKSQVALLRLTTAGARDTSFASNGLLATQFGAVTCAGPYHCAYDEPMAMVLTATGETWITGRYYVDGANPFTTPQLAMGRVSGSGSLLLGQRIPRTYALEGLALMRQSDGKLVVGGRARTTSNTTDADFVLLRMLGTP